MKIIPVSGWELKTIDELLSEWSFTPQWGENMLQLVNRLRSLPDERTLYADIDHWILILQPEERDHALTWLWIMTSAGSEKKEYGISYRMPDSDAPWQNAFLGGHAHSLDEAVEMVLIAMDKSDGWKDN